MNLPLLVAVATVLMIISVAVIIIFHELLGPALSILILVVFLVTAGFVSFCLRNANHMTTASSEVLRAARLVLSQNAAKKSQRAKIESRVILSLPSLQWNIGGLCPVTSITVLTLMSVVLDNAITIILGFREK